nr:cytochrome c [Microvirga roseola]
MQAAADRREIALGRQLYASYCAACHGAALEGQPDWQTPKEDGRMPAPPHDESGHTWHHGDRELFLITKKGMGAVVPGYESDMPAFEGILSDAEIRAVLAFIRSTWSARAREYQEERSKAEAARP